MCRPRRWTILSGVVAMLAGVVVSVSAATPALADIAPRSAAASPDVYKILADDKGMRMILATWQPGQRDQWHSHPIMAVYWLVGCDARIYSPDGSFVDVKIKTGQVGVQQVIESHSFENRSDSECKALMVERE